MFRAIALPSWAEMGVWRKKQMEYAGSLFAEWLILQASYPIFEGDDVVLRCQGRKEENINEKTYYRNEKEISNHLKGSIMLRSVFKNNNQYHCTASGKSIWGSWETTSNLLKIQVQGNGYTPVGNRAWQQNHVWNQRGVLISGDFMRGLFWEAMGRRWEVAPCAWVPTSWRCAENSGACF